MQCKYCLCSSSECECTGAIRPIYRSDPDQSIYRTHYAEPEIGKIITLYHFDNCLYALTEGGRLYIRSSIFIKGQENLPSHMRKTIDGWKEISRTIIRE